MPAERRIAYNSCRNRNCPKCGAAARAEWLDRQAADLLPVEYFHLVFTLPNAVGPVALQNPSRVYGALFRAAADSLSELAADPKHLGAEVGFLAVLHTWGQTLTLHPHVHCVVPGGGLSLDGERWVSCRSGFFLPVRPLSRLFRGKFLASLQEFHGQGDLVLAGTQAELADPLRFARWMDELRESEWVVHAKPPWGGPEQVLKYLARYAHRVAISNHRLAAIDDRSVTFHWKDYADGNTQKVMTLDGVEFIRRFLQHVMPSGFVRIRHFGLLANRHRDEKLSRCRTLLAECSTASTPAASMSEVTQELTTEGDGGSGRRHCGVEQAMPGMREREHGRHRGTTPTQCELASGADRGWRYFIGDPARVAASENRDDASRKVAVDGASCSSCKSVVSSLEMG